MNKISELVVYLKKKGLKNTISRIKSRYFSITKFVLFSMDIEDASETFEANPEVEYCLGNIEILKQYRLEHTDLPREFYVDQTHGGKEFYLGYYMGKLAQICWVFRRGEYSRFFDLTDDACCELNYIITLPEFSGNGLPAKMTYYIRDQLAKQNIKKIVVGISANNTFMLKGMKKTGFTELSSVKSYFSLLHKTKIQST